MTGALRLTRACSAAGTVIVLGGLGCSDGGDAVVQPPPESLPGAIQVVTQTGAETAAAALDPDGYHVVMDGLALVPIEVNGSVTISGVAADIHAVALQGLQVNCTTAENPLAVKVESGTTVQATFPVTCWAPTTGRIAFTAPRNSSPNPNTENWVWEIYTIRPDGTDLRRVTTTEDLGPRMPAHLWPSWSPDGWKIAYTHDYNDKGNQDIYVINADGTGKTQLTSAAGRDNYPAWSPDGSRIAFSSDRDGNDLEIYVVNADGTGLLQLTDNELDDTYLGGWSPDGTRILFTTADGPGEPDVFAIGPDGTDLVNLTKNPLAWDWTMGRAYSPDGSRIVFASERDGNWEIYVMNADGTRQTRLTHTDWNEEPAAWSPDGTKILFMSYKTNLIYYMNADGTGVRSVTHAVGGRNLWPDWSHGTGAVGDAG